MTQQNIIHNQLTLSLKSSPASQADLNVAQDLKDTLLANKDKAAGLAANMIGQYKRIIALFIGPLPLVMLNPVITSATNEYVTQEGCLSLNGQRSTKRFKNITVKYQNENFETHEQKFSNFTAEVIQHEIDHCNGILI